jgi:hypothetical protein
LQYLRKARPCKSSAGESEVASWVGGKSGASDESKSSQLSGKWFVTFWWNLTLQEPNLTILSCVLMVVFWLWCWWCRCIRSVGEICCWFGDLMFWCHAEHKQDSWKYFFGQNWFVFSMIFVLNLLVKFCWAELYMGCGWNVYGLWLKWIWDVDEMSMVCLPEIYMGQNSCLNLGPILNSVYYKLGCVVAIFLEKCWHQHLPHQLPHGCHVFKLPRHQFLCHYPR